MAVATQRRLVRLSDARSVLPWSKQLLDDLEFRLDAIAAQANAGGGGGGSVTSVSAGVGLTATPDPIVGVGTIDLEDTAVTPGTYGSATELAQFAVDQQGRITAAAEFSLSSVDHGIFSGLLDDDHTIYARLSGRAGGQSLLGGTGGSDQLVLSGPSGTLVQDALAVGLTAGQLPVGQVHAFKGAAQSLFLSQTHSNTVGEGPLVYFRRARGTTYGSPSAIQSGDIIGTFGMQGYGSDATFADGAAFEAYATENWSGTNRGTTLQLYCTKNASAAIYKAWETLTDGGINHPGPTFTYGTAGTATAFQVGAGTTGSDGSTFRIRSGNSGSTLAALYLMRNTTEVAFWACDGSNTAFAYTGSMIFSSGIGGPTRLAVDASGNMTLAAKIISYNGITTDPDTLGVPVLVDFQSATGLSIDVSATNYNNANTAGLYRVSVYVVVTTADATAGSVSVNTLWNDGTAARTVSATASMAATNYAQTITHLLNTSGSVQFSITHTGSFGTAQYAVYLMCERVV